MTDVQQQLSECPTCRAPRLHEFVASFACGSLWSDDDAPDGPGEIRVCDDALVKAFRQVEDRERERWTTAARKHAGTWMQFATPDANVIASDYLMWAASMQPVNDDGMRVFSLTALGPNDD